MQGIYAIVNTVNGKRYVGSAVNIRKRWEIHRHHLLHGTHHSTHLQRAWLKHGPNAFRWEIIEEVALLADLLAREQHWIDATPRTLRYNTSPTAGSLRGHKLTPEQRKRHAVSWLGKHFSPEHLAKLVASRKGKHMSEGARKAISAYQLTRVRPASIGQNISKGKKGKPFTEAHKQALSAAKKGKPWTEAQRQASLRPGWARKPKPKTEKEG